MRNFVIRLESKLFRLRKKNRLKNKNFSILSSNCNGAVILHDLEQPFDTPTVDLYFLPDDFIKFLKNPKHYLDIEPVELMSNHAFPVGEIDDIKVYFMHYDSFDKAKEKWIKRSKRIHWDNIYIMMTDRDGCTYENILEFDSLPYQHKIILVHKPYPEIKSAYYMSGYKDASEVGVLSDFKPKYFRRRWIDDFDYVSFLNDR